MWTFLKIYGERIRLMISKATVINNFSLTSTPNAHTHQIKTRCNLGLLLLQIDFSTQRLLNEWGMDEKDLLMSHVGGIRQILA